MTKREIICSQYSHCLSCPLSIKITGKDCRQLLQKEIEELRNDEFNAFLINRINLTNDLQEKFNRKYGESNEVKKNSNSEKH